MRYWTLAALCGALAGCAAQPMWIKEGAGAQDYATDSYLCERDAHQSYFGAGVLGAIAMIEFEKRCMVAHGWRDATPPR